MVAEKQEARELHENAVTHPLWQLENLAAPGPVTEMPLALRALQEVQVERLRHLGMVIPDRVS
jgi:hypothetical protein